MFLLMNPVLNDPGNPKEWKHNIFPCRSIRQGTNKARKKEHFEAVLWKFAGAQNLRFKEPLSEDRLLEIVKAKTDFQYPLSKVGWTNEQRQNGGLKKGPLLNAHNALRDEAIFNDYKRGFTAKKLSKIYRLNVSRIYKIIARNRP